MKFKGGERFATDLAAALGIDRASVCSELGTLDCVREAHNVTLGGVEPYVLGVRKPLAISPVTAAIAVDRVALAACINRVDNDAQQPESHRVFDGAPLTPARRAAIMNTLYISLLSRPATADETAALETLAAAEGDDPVPSDRDWAVAACLAVATTLESLFY